ncbi:MAG: hypothetical protein AAB943_00600 [Patescibacteria group bacterium]
MLKFIAPAILIAIAIAGFFVFTNPLYKDLVQLKEQAASYNEALDNSKRLENERDKLTKKYNTVDPENLAKLEKLLPDSVDNIRLILEIEKVALPFGMSLKDVQYDMVKKDSKTEGNNAGQSDTTSQPENNRDYGMWELSFSTSGTYNNFVNFIKDLERNLRIVDISSVQFSSNVGTGLNPGFAEVYKYAVKIKTYWLKN